MWCSTTTQRSTTTARHSNQPSARLDDRQVTVEALDDVIKQGARHTDGPDIPRGDSDALRLLIYTSGSTGTPKGAMYTDRLMAKTWGGFGWVGSDLDAEGSKLPAITLSFMPVSHVMGRVILYSTLGAGGTAYFAAKSDLSTLLDDLALVRPTKLDLVPRIWEMLFQEVQSEVDRRTTDGADRDAVETQVMAEQREKLIGGRQFSAMTGSAPISPELMAWVEEFIDIHLANGYGSTEDGVVTVDGQIRRPPVLDYKLVDVPDLGYFATDRPHPRGELWIKSADVIPGYYKRPEVTAELFDAEGWYHTGDVVAEIAPDHLAYVDRRNNVLKLSQGEFVTVSKLEAAYGGHPSIRQIFVYGNSARSYVLAVIVPTDDALASVGGDVAAVKPILSDALQSTRARPGSSPTRFRATSWSRQRLSRWRTVCSPVSASWLGRNSSSTTAPSSSSSTPTWPTARQTCCARCGTRAPAVPFWRRSPGPRVRCSARPRLMWHPMRRSPISAETRCRR